MKPSGKTPLVPTVLEVISAYLNGYYPMASGKHGSIGFYYYEPRAIIPLDDRFKVRRSVRQAIRKSHFTVRFDTAFEEVVRACARHDELPDQEIWISEEMIPLYLELHQLHIAHSVETWKDNRLVGGLFGLVFGAAFCGESMFSNVPYASQAALIALVEHLRSREFALLDAQMPSEHLEQFGMIPISQREYMRQFSVVAGNEKVSF